MHPPEEQKDMSSNPNPTAAVNAVTGAAAHLENYQPGISANFEIPLHVGKLVAQWDSPEFASAADALGMRGDDYVVGLVHHGIAAAFPMWVADNYHIINCVIAGSPVVYVTCERCQSGSAFHSVVNGRPVKFSAMGMYNASLTMTDRAGFLRRPGSLWLHYEGVCIDGPSQGVFLDPISTLHTTWRDWLELHPDSIVMLPPDDKHHRDARHGHGREEYFSRPGMDPPLVLTITGDLDSRFPENEMVLGINVDELVKAYPLKEVKKSGSVVHDKIGEVTIAVFAGPKPEQVSMSAFACVVRGKTLSFTLEEGNFVDEQTGSKWNIEGRATEGELAGEQLDAIRCHYVRWHAWFYPHRNTQLHLHSGELPVYPAVRFDLNVSIFRELLDSLANLGRPIMIENAVPSLSLPHEASAGLSVNIGSDRMNVYRFDCVRTAEDYVEFQGGWFCQPISTRIGRKVSIRVGEYVIESDPEIQYADPAQFVRLPDPQILWSDIVTDLGLIQRIRIDPEPGMHEHTPSFSLLLKHLRDARYDVVEAAFLPHTQLRVGTQNAVAATINGDRFAIYKCSSADAARTVCSEVTHAICIDRWVFRSIPVLMYQDPCYEMGQLPENEIRWSPLLSDPRFSSCVDSFCQAMSSRKNVPPNSYSAAVPD